MLLGVDLGSGGAKITLLSIDGRVVATVFKEYATYYPRTSWAEQKPEDWWTALRDSVKELIEKFDVNPADILAVSVDGPTHTAVLLDRDLSPLQNAIFWTDQRSTRQSKWLNNRYGERILGLTLHRPGTVWTLSHLLWVKEEQPEIWKSIRHILFEKDYIRYRLTGNLATDYIEAMGTLLFDAEKMSWSHELCDMIGLNMTYLPEIVKPQDVAGRVTKDASLQLGIIEGTPVIVGSTDTALEIFGTGAIKAGQATVKLATAGRICIVTDNPCQHEFLINYPHIIPGKWYPGTATRSCASSYRWYKETFGEKEQEISEITGISPYFHFDEQASAIPAGCEGLIFHPYLLGELTPYNDPDLKGSFTGISMKHSKAHFTRAVLEGVAFSLYDCFEVLKQLKLTLHEAMIIGGGSRSVLWRQIVADMLGICMKKPANTDSSFGSAMLAGIGIGVFRDFEDAVKKCVKIDTFIEPDMERHEKYMELYKIYREIHDGISEAYKKLSLII